MNARAAQTVTALRIRRMIGQARPRRRLPRQVVPRAIERAYAALLRDVVGDVRTILQPLIDALPSLLSEAETAKRFDDAAATRRFNALMERARHQLRAQMSPVRLEQVTERFGRRIADFQRIQFGRQVKAGLGIDLLGSDRKIRALVDGFVRENVALITNIPERLAGQVEQTISRGMTRGLGVRELGKSLEKHFEGEEDRAARIARDQVLTLYGQVNSSRQQELGLTHFVWRTVGDDAVRDEHRERDGETYSWSDPPDGEIPGEPINCRCYAEPVMSDIFDAAKEER